MRDRSSTPTFLNVDLRPQNGISFGKTWIPGSDYEEGWWLRSKSPGLIWILNQTRHKGSVMRSSSPNGQKIDQKIGTSKLIFFQLCPMYPTSVEKPLHIHLSAAFFFVGPKLTVRRGFKGKMCCHTAIIENCHCLEASCTSQASDVTLRVHHHKFAGLNPSHFQLFLFL